MTESEWLASDDPQAMLRWLRYETGNGMADGPPMSFPRLTDRKLRLFACACARQVWHLLADGRARAAVETAERFADGLATSKDRGLAFNASDNLRGEQQSIAYGCLRANVAYGAGEAAFHARQCGARPTAQAAVLRCIVGNPHRPVEPAWATFAVSGERGRRPVVDWLTPTVLSLAQAAYDERAGRKCARCKGTGHEMASPEACGDPPAHLITCRWGCDKGRIDDGALDPACLAVLADALEEAGCDNEPLLRHLRGWWPCRTCDGEGCHGEYMQNVCENCGGTGWARLYTPHVRGCWALDLILGRK